MLAVEGIVLVFLTIIGLQIHVIYNLLTFVRYSFIIVSAYPSHIHRKASRFDISPFLYRILSVSCTVLIQP